MDEERIHDLITGYFFWIFGFLRAHHFYFGKPLSGTVYFFTMGLFLIGWIVGLFLIPAMEEEANLHFTTGPVDYSLAWILLIFLGLFGIHRMVSAKASFLSPAPVS